MGDSIFAGNKGSCVARSSLSPEGVANVRSDTIWYLDIADMANLGGQIDLVFDLSVLGLTASGHANDYVLLWRSGQSGQFYEIATADSATGTAVVFEHISVDTTATAAQIQSNEGVINEGYFKIGENDTGAPEYQRVEVTGNTVDLVFDEYLDEIATPDATAFTVEVNGSSRTVSNVLMKGQHVALTFDGSTVTSDSDVVTVSYTVPTSGAVLQDVAGNNMATISNIIIGSEGDDISTGISGDDIFIGNGGDKLDLSGLLEGYISGDDLSQYIQVSDDGTSTTLNIDKNGGGDNFGTRAHDHLRKCC